MNITLPSNKSGGFTLIEILVAMSVLAATTIISTTFIFGVREKTILITDTGKLVSALEYARQQSISAYKGQQYSVQLLPAKTYIILPENSQRKLQPSISISSSQPQTVTFTKLTGKPDTFHTITLRSSHLKTIITIDSLGLISFTPPEPL